jgi:hypothetical protein
MNKLLNSMSKLLLGMTTAAVTLIPNYNAEAANIVLTGFNPENSLLPGLLEAESHSVDAETYQSEYPTNMSGIDALVVQTEFSEYFTPEAFLFSIAATLNASVAGSPSIAALTPSSIIIPNMRQLDEHLMLVGTLLPSGVTTLTGQGEEATWIMAYTLGDDCSNLSICPGVANTISRFLTLTDEPTAVPEPASILGLLAFGTAGLLVSRKAS